MTAHAHPAGPGSRQRLRAGVAALGVGALAAVLHWVGRKIAPTGVADFDQLWFAARALVGGDNPYNLVGPGRSFDWPWPLLYPLPAALLVAPLAWMPVAVAGAAFAFVCGATFGYAVARSRSAPFLVLSAPFAIGVMQGQSAPILAAITLSPWAAIAVAAKPNIGFAVLAGAGRRSWIVAIVAGALLAGLSFLVSPTWVADWRAAVETVPHARPYVLRPWGVLLLAALTRWRRPEARVLAAFAVVPGTPSTYDLLVPLTAVLVDATPRVAALIAASSLLAVASAYGTPAGDFVRFADRAAVAHLAFVLLPCLVAVLARPNERENGSR